MKKMVCTVFLFPFIFTCEGKLEKEIAVLGGDGFKYIVYLSQPNILAYFICLKNKEGLSTEMFNINLKSNTIKKAEHRRIDVFELWCWRKTLESPLDCKEIQPVHPKGNQSWVFIGRTDVEAETPILWPPDSKS